MEVSDVEGAPVERGPVRWEITAEDILRPEILLSIAAILTIIAGTGARSITVIIIALIMCGVAAISLGFIASPLLERVFPIISVSTICGVILFFLGIETIISPGGSHWSFGVMLISGLVSLFAAFRAYTRAGLGIGRRGL